MKKILLLILLVFLYVLINNAVTVRIPAPLPIIGDFSAIRVGKEVRLKFSFRNIAGGIEYTESILEAKITKIKDGTNPIYGMRQVMLNQWIDYNVVNINEDPTKGIFEFVALNIPYDSKLEEGDTITFTIRLVDKLGRESNKIERILRFSYEILI